MKMKLDLDDERKILALREKEICDITFKHEKLKIRA